MYFLLSCLCMKIISESNIPWQASWRESVAFYGGEQDFIRNQVELSIYFILFSLLMPIIIHYKEKYRKHI